MVSRDFSGADIVSVLCNVGNYRLDRIRGDHYILKWDPPEDHDTEPRTVPVPYHDRIDTGTLSSIAEQAGANDFDEFCRWIDRNR
ncbi:type II toxin-antitoxin system HicA family toxin [Halomicrobium salinisoli]|uniref:type II toxin-antitoxin system HicA family toxin n=1 Tax=Halomicrobium salinisoli TaxID=2878391 RepID=UPI001CF02415|nr:type II toxin-antitoxin system HicA family toxin [Halomicrobium salinisoli]